MKSFFKNLTSSCLGTILALIILVVVLVGIGSMFSSKSRTTKIENNSVLNISFKGLLPEYTNNIKKEPFNIDDSKVLGLSEIISAIEHAKNDDKIKGIVIRQPLMKIGMATIRAIRRAIIDFKDSGKFVYAYGDLYSEGGYYLVSVADSIFLNPLGGLEFNGLGTTRMFFKEAQDALGINMHIYYAGKFKGATEPFRRNDFSEPNRLQIKEYLTDLHTEMLEDISKSRKISFDDLIDISNQSPYFSKDEALSYKLVDGIIHEEDFMQMIKDKIDSNKKNRKYLVSLNKYSDSFSPKKNFKIKDKIAIIYAEGELKTMDDNYGVIGGLRYAKTIRKIRENKNIKAVVLRVNSPGGEVLAGEKIWKEFELLKEKGIPIVVSMGDVAASGGYYISCLADKIYAEENTITGSIGVFGVIPSLEKLYSEKLKLHVDTVKTSRYATEFSLAYDHSPKLKEVIQKNIDNIYDIFLQKVADGRNMTKEQVHEIAQGRVWSGKKAVEIGLVDQIGDLDDAIAEAKKLAGLDDYRISNYPKLKDPIQKMIEELMGKKLTKADFIESEIEKNLPEIKYLLELKEMEGPQIRIPFIVEGI